MRNGLILILVIILFANSCKEKKDPSILSKAKMELVLWDFIRADVYTYQYLKKDSVLNDTLENMKLQQKIFRNYKITREDFVRSYQYYIERPVEMNAILDSISVRQSKASPIIKPKEL